MAQESYDLHSVKFPRLAGPSLRLIVGLLESPLGGLLTQNMLKNAGVLWLRDQIINEGPTPQPIHFLNSAPADPETTVPQTQWPAPGPAAPGFHFPTVHEYAQGYREGRFTPEDVAARVQEAIEASNATHRDQPPLRAVIASDSTDLLRQAHESAARWKNGRPLSILDGVPVAVKDEINQRPYPTTVGTAFLGNAPATDDATVVARLRAAGALLIGKTNMHEIGIGVTGSNPIHGTPRNPYAPGHYTGGSSSGSAVAVAAGFCPLAIGADGGGSIRIPASFCGVVGLKPTYGRVSEYGAAPLCWSVAHIGPLAASVTDAALGYALMAGPDLLDANTLRQPTPLLEGWNRSDLHGLTLGIYWPWFRHAAPEVVAVCETLLQQFELLGGQLQEITLPDLEAARIAHTVTIAGEMAQALSATYPAHHHEHSLEVRLSLALARAFTTMDYVKAQRVRTQLMASFDRALQKVDLILTPATGIAAPAIPTDALKNGESDISTLVEIMRFATPGNLTGLPAISFPAGYTPAGLPVGMQAIGRAWEEPLLLRLALAAEQRVERKAPQIYHKVFPG